MRPVSILPVAPSIVFAVSDITEGVCKNMLCKWDFFLIVKVVEQVEKHEILLHKLSLTMWFIFLWQLKF